MMSKSFPLQTAIRQEQFHQLSEDFGFVTLPLLNMEVPQDSVICSPNLFNETTILVVVHDTPEIWAKRNVITGTIDPSTSLVVDSGAEFIKWGLERKYGIMDINIPQSLFEQENYTAVLTSQEILIYIWDNYLKFFPSLTKVAFIGIGDASAGIVHLLGHRDTRSVVKSVVSFIGKKPLKPLVPLVNESLGDWYFKNSLVFTDHSHSCWGDNENRKPRKKFGRVLRCDAEGMNNIIEERLEESTDFILDSFEEWSDSE
ncbi:Arb2 domain [Nakaseomyces glabratus]